MVRINFVNKDKLEKSIHKSGKGQSEIYVLNKKKRRKSGNAYTTHQFYHKHISS